MDTNKFIKLRPFLYHLTDERNLESIINEGEILSTVTLIRRSEIVHPNHFLRNKRDQHTEILINGLSYFIRDQQPISEVVLRRSLEAGCSYEQYIYLLNSLVFFWPSESRLNRHYNRYISEKPVILRLSTEEVFNINPYPLFSKYNSGATRCSSHWGGNAPMRGFSTFSRAGAYNHNPSTVAEVTFRNSCVLPENIFVGRSPNGRFVRV